MAFNAYIVTCLVNRKQYVGISVRPVIARWLEHVSAAKKKSNRPFLSAIKKYGKEVFSIEHIACAKNFSDLKEVEKLLIVQHGTRSPSGYNVTDGGDGTWGHKHSEETRHLLSQYSRPQSEEIRKKISDSLKGRSRPPEIMEMLRKSRIGKRHSEETKKHIGDVQRGRKQSEATKAKRAASRSEWWDKASQETRAEIGAKISAGKKAHAQRRIMEALLGAA